MCQYPMEHQWPKGLNLGDAILTIPQGAPVESTSVSNSTNHDITIGRKTCLGSLQAIQSILPKETQAETCKQQDGSVVSVAHFTTESADIWDLNHHGLA